MSPSPATPERLALHSALQAVLDEYRPGALLNGWVVTLELSEGGDGGRTLMHRNAEVGGEPLTPWDYYGMAGTTFEDARDRLRGARADAHDDGPPSG